MDDPIENYPIVELLPAEYRMAYSAILESSTDGVFRLEPSLQQVSDILMREIGQWEESETKAPFTVTLTPSVLEAIDRSLDHVLQFIEDWDLEIRIRASRKQIKITRRKIQKIANSNW